MNILRFPGRSAAMRREDDEFADARPDEDEAPCHADGENPFFRDEPAADIPAAPTRPPRRSARRLSPAEILAGSIAGAHGARLTPAQVIAQAMTSSARTVSPLEHLQQSFWQIWLQHQDYLKKKVSIFWIAAARTLKTS